MENNFGLILLDLVGKNKDKFLGLLRRNGVLVSTNTSNEDLTNMILKAMQKSESFKKETIMFMGVLMSESNDGSFANMGGYSNASGYFSNLPTFDINTFSTTTSSTTTEDKKDKPKKDFKDTTVGTIFDKLFTLGNKYLENKELDVREKEAKAGQIIAQQGGGSQTGSIPPPKSNTGLYIALGIGGIALIGTLIYVVSKKK
jgi:hypothetical protein